jgi:hypothetical protein
VKSLFLILEAQTISSVAFHDQIISIQSNRLRLDDELQVYRGPP